MATRQLDLPSITALVLEVDGPDTIEACSILEDVGIRVHVAYDEGDALEILGGQRIDFALLAVKLLYGKTSLSIATLLAESGAPFILTYQTLAERRLIPAELRDRPALKKPLSPQVTLEAVRKLLESRNPKPD